MNAANPYLQIDAAHDRAMAKFDSRIDFEEAESAELAEKWLKLDYIAEIDYDEDEIQFAMKEHGLSRGQMIRKLASDYVESNFDEINQEIRWN